MKEIKQMKLDAHIEFNIKGTHYIYFSYHLRYKFKLLPNLKSKNRLNFLFV